jgi:hypothetical protein
MFWVIFLWMYIILILKDEMYVWCWECSWGQDDTKWVLRWMTYVVIKTLKCRQLSIIWYARNLGRNFSEPCMNICASAHIYVCEPWLNLVLKKITMSFLYYDWCVVPVIGILQLFLGIIKDYFHTPIYVHLHIYKYIFMCVYYSYFAW